MNYKNGEDHPNFENHLTIFNFKNRYFYINDIEINRPKLSEKFMK